VFEGCIETAGQRGAKPLGILPKALEVDHGSQFFGRPGVSPR
jgi:hypothetical protein